MVQNASVTPIKLRLDLFLLSQTLRTLGSLNNNFTISR
jgi:hypothetical protein